MVGHGCLELFIQLWLLGPGVVAQVPEVEVVGGGSGLKTVPVDHTYQVELLLTGAHPALNLHFWKKTK